MRGNIFCKEIDSSFRSGVCQSSATDLKLKRQLILCLTSEADSELQEANNSLGSAHELRDSTVQP